MTKFFRRAWWPSTLTKRWAVPAEINAGRVRRASLILRPGALPAAHREDHCPGLKLQITEVLVDDEDCEIVGDIQQHGVHQGFDTKNP